MTSDGEGSTTIKLKLSLEIASFKHDFEYFSKAPGNRDERSIIRRLSENNQRGKKNLSRQAKLVLVLSTGLREANLSKCLRMSLSESVKARKKRKNVLTICRKCIQNVKLIGGCDS